MREENLKPTTNRVSKQTTNPIQKCILLKEIIAWKISVVSKNIHNMKRQIKAGFMKTFRAEFYILKNPHIRAIKPKPLSSRRKEKANA